MASQKGTHKTRKPSDLCMALKLKVSETFGTTISLLVFLKYVCLCTIYVPGAQGSLKRMSYVLELWLQMVLSHHVGAGKQIWVL